VLQWSPVRTAQQPISYLKNQNGNDENVYEK
jgi:hypothetical protein